MRALTVLAIAVAAASLPTDLAFAADPAAGEKAFRKCQACHAVGDKAKNKVGPVLNGIVGRDAGKVQGFNYSEANKSSGIVWTHENLDAYLENPRKLMPGTKMAFPGLRDPEERANVIAYLEQFK